MDIQTIIQDYLKQPLPLWEKEITTLLVENKWETLAKQYQINPDTYSIAACIIKDESNKESYLSLPLIGRNIKIELPTDDLKGFYEKHGLEPVVFNPVDSTNPIGKITSALNMLQHIEPVHNFILNIVKSVQLINADYPDTDVSYSHPEIPFSIFFSVCDEVSTISDLRVAESILHEAMHLKLTLIENHIDLIDPNSNKTFYSPWRDENRPLRGVLHGLFVFKAIKDFYNLLNIEYSQNGIEDQFINFRIEEIEKEFELLKWFPNAVGLTIYGKVLATRLLQF